MTLFERIKKLAKDHGKGVSRVATDLGFSENLFYRWKTSEPKARDLEKVADYFNVSVDYLLGRTDNPQSKNSNTVTEEDLDKALEGVMNWKGEPLTEADREAVRIFMEGRKSK